MEMNEQTYNGLQQYLLQTLNPATQKEGISILKTRVFCFIL